MKFIPSSSDEEEEEDKVDELQNVGKVRYLMCHRTGRLCEVK